MTTQLIPFNFKDVKIDITLDEHSNPWFVANQICSVLGIENSRDATSRLHEDEKLMSVLPTSGQRRRTTLINESGLYTLMFRSRLEKAQEFRKWVTSEVLPEIRKTGKYELRKEKETPLERVELKKTIPEQIKDACDVFKPLYEVLTLIGIERNHAAISANQATTKVAGYDILKETGNTCLVSANQEVLGAALTPTELGLKINKTAQQINEMLRSKNLQYKTKGKWLVTDEAEGYYVRMVVGKNYHDGTPIEQLKWYESVLDLLKSKRNKLN